MKRLTTAFLALLMVASVRAQELRVAAAASLAEAITEIAGVYPGAKVQPVFAGSNVLARQIEAGAPVDVFFSADEKTMDGLVKGGQIETKAVVPLLKNSLVVVVASDSTLTLESAADLAKVKRLSIGDPAAVPVGVYTKTWLKGRGLWETLQPKCVGAENVRAALAAVEAGNADAAVVYATDAAISKKVKIAFKVPASESPEILYPVAVCAASKQGAEAQAFVAFLQSGKSTEIFKKRGFQIVTRP